MTMHGEAEVALSVKFNRQKFSDFILSQGLLPPTLLRQSIQEEFIPRQKSPNSKTLGPVVTRRRGLVIWRSHDGR